MVQEWVGRAGRRVVAAGLLALAGLTAGAGAALAGPAPGSQVPAPTPARLLLASTAPLATELYGTVTSAAGWAVAGLAAWRLLRGRADSGLLYLLLGGVFLTLAGALPDLPALGRSQLASGFGPVATRAAITVTLGLGAAMVVAGLVGFRAPRRPEPAGVS